MDLELLLMIDIETTGLDPHHDQILEVAGFLVDKETLVPVPYTGFNWVVKHDPDTLVTRMYVYERNGLRDEVRDGTPLHEVETLLHDMLADYEEEGYTIYPCGYSVHFDVSFLKVHMADVAAILSHQIVDVTTLALMSDKPLHPKARTHRARDDINEIYQEFLYLV